MMKSAFPVRTKLTISNDECELSPGNIQLVISVFIALAHQSGLALEMISFAIFKILHDRTKHERNTK